MSPSLSKSGKLDKVGNYFQLQKQPFSAAKSIYTYDTYIKLGS